MAQTLFITGASSGIGAATARSAAMAGWNVALFARSKDKLDALAEEIGAKALALPGDPPGRPGRGRGPRGGAFRRARRRLRQAAAWTAPAPWRARPRISRR